MRKHWRPTISLAALLMCLIALNLIKAFVQPADAVSAYAVPALNDYYADDTAYYCMQYALQASSAASICQAPVLAADSLVASRPDTPALSAKGCGVYDSIFRTFDWDVSIAEAICQAESGGDPMAISPTNDYGLMQLHDMAIFDPVQNIAAAYQKYLRQGWGAWTTYRTGAYLQFE